MRTRGCSNLTCLNDLYYTYKFKKRREMFMSGTNDFREMLNREE